jgi:nucleoside-diphosphate-sugar epimerase
VKDSVKTLNILLTGATGFLGSHLLRAFVAKGWNVSIIKRSFSSTNRIQDLLPAVTALDIDAAPLAALFEQKGPFDAVVHAATCYGRHGETATQVLEANLGFSLSLLETATLYNTTTFYNTTTTLYPYLNAYALSKRQFEDWGRMFSSQGRIRFVNLKVEHMYGPDDEPSKFTTFIFLSLKNNISEIALTLGEQKRDFIYIDDVVEAYIILLKQIRRDSVFTEYEIGSGEAVSIRDFVETARKVIGSSSNLLFGAKEYREHEVMFSQADIKKMMELGWKPQVSLEQGILKTM